MGERVISFLNGNHRRICYHHNIGTQSTEVRLSYRDKTTSNNTTTLLPLFRILKIGKEYQLQNYLGGNEISSTKIG
nr:MAG TPA: hypothetical protein [Caudoviricetes sp.]